MLSVPLGANLTLTGVIQDGTDTNSSVTHDLTANGTGVVILSNTETYTGNTNVDTGVLTLSPGASIVSGGSKRPRQRPFQRQRFLPRPVNQTGTLYPTVNVDAPSHSARLQRAPCGLNITAEPSPSHRCVACHPNILTTAGLTMMATAMPAGKDS